MNFQKPEDPAELLEFVRTRIGRDPLATLLGLEVEEVDQAYAKISLTPNSGHLNLMGTVHGGTVCVLVDQVVAMAANTMDSGMTVVLENKINFLNPALSTEKLFAEARLLDRKRRVALWEVRITDGQNRLVSTAQSMSYHKG